ncbi:MAG: hypothetical protein ACYTFT_16905, partial [Planctomycetota bacterium]
RRALALLAVGLSMPVALPAAGQETSPTAREVQLEERVQQLEKRLEALESQEPADELEALKREAEAEIEAGEQEAGEAGEASLTESATEMLNALNPRLTVFGDAAAPIELTGNEGEADDRFSVRELEIDFRAAIDPYASGVVIVAVEEEEPNEYIVDAEEAYLTLDGLPWGFGLKLGRFLPELGGINRLHSHDLPWTLRPLPVRDFVAGDEGYKESGGQLSWLSPELGPAAITLQYSLLNGEGPEPVMGGEESDDPAHLFRAEAFIELGATTSLTLGGNFLFGFNDADAKKETQLWVWDAAFKVQPSQEVSFVAFGELYYLEKEVAGGKEYAHGAWVGAQVQPGLGTLWAPLSQTYFGLRYDLSSYDEQVEDADQWALAAYVSYYTTEFLRFRIGYEHRERETTGGGNPDEKKLLFQITFVFGSHPAEPFWFNR